MGAGDDLPMISPSSDSTQVDITPQKEVRVNAPDARRTPATEAPKPASAPAVPAGRVMAPSSSALPPTPHANDPRKASDARSPGSVSPVKPASAAPARPAGDASASRPGGPAVKAAPASQPSEEEDPEKLLREYADRQKTKVLRLEQQLAEYRKVVAERDALRAKVDALGKELQDSKRQLEAAGKSDDVIKDLQGKVDAAILSNSILADDKEKLKKGLSQQTDHLKKAEDRAAAAEKSLAEAQKRLAAETEGREEAEARVAAALEALQGGDEPAEAAAEKPVSEMATRPIKAPPELAEEKPAAAAAKSATTPVPAKGPPPRPPGRFSFLKK